MSKQLLVKPRMSEKAYGTSQSGVYVVEVPRSANKLSVAQALTDQFNVTVEAVNITNVKGKTKRVMSITGKRVSRQTGQRSNIKKAYVRLKQGDSLPFFEAIEKAEEKQQATQEKVTQAMEKQATKESQPSRRGLHLPGRRGGTRGGDK